MAKQFIEYLKVQYPNFKMYFGYPTESQVAITFLEKIEAELLDACLTMELKKEDFVRVSPHYEVIMLSNERYEEYATLKVGFKQIDTYRCYKIELLQLA